jgi:hypothetical protein
MPDSPGVPGWFIAAFVIIALVGVGSTIARALYRQSRGVDPFFAKEQVEATIVNSELMRPREEHPHDAEQPHKSIEQRLTELEDLHSRGVISDEELRAARANVLEHG